MTKLLRSVLREWSYFRRRQSRMQEAVYDIYYLLSIVYNTY
jgi:hypothetical protein